MVNFGLEIPRISFWGSQGPGGLRVKTCTPCHVARLAERAAPATPSSEAKQFADPSNKTLRKYGTNVINYEWHYIFGCQGSQECDSVKFPSFFFVFFVRQLQEETPALKRPKLETEAYWAYWGLDALGGYFFQSLDFQEGLEFWSKLIFESSQTHFLRPVPDPRKPENPNGTLESETRLNISIKATQT